MMPEDVFLGAPLPGALVLPFWRAGIGSRGDNPTLEWGIADSPALVMSEAAVAEFVSVPKLRLGGRKPTRGLAGVTLHTVRTMPDKPPLMGGPPWYGGRGVLDDFVKLGKLPDAAIGAFASHWGPLGICRHNVPWTHSLTRLSMTSVEPPCRPLGLGEKRPPHVVKKFGVIGGWEPLAKWRLYSALAASIVHDATRLKNSRRDRRSREDVAKLNGQIRDWTQKAGVTLLAYTEPDYGDGSWPRGLTLTFGIVGVFQIVALQLFALVVGGRGLGQCSHCGAPFALSGHREGKRSFCATCITGKVPARYASFDYRSRKKKRGRDGTQTQLR